MNFKFLERAALVIISAVALGFVGGLFGMTGMMLLMILLHKGMGDPLANPEVGLISVFWAANAAVVFGILGGILGLILAIRFLRKKGPKA